MAGRGDAPPPFGGGRVFLLTATSITPIEPDPRDPWSWSIPSIEGLPTSQSNISFGALDEEGRLAFFEDRTAAQEAPWVVMLSGSEEERVAYRTEEDDYGWDLSPDGRFLYVRSENPDAPSYQHDLVRVDLTSGASRVLFESDMPLNSTGGVSPDGRRLAVVRRGEPEDLIVMAADGSPVYQSALPRASAVRWCGSGERLLMLRSAGLSTPQFALLDPGSGEERAIPAAGFPSSVFDCSPDGTAVFYQAALDGRRTMILLDLDTGEWRDLALYDLPIPRSIRWIPDTPQIIPERLELRADRLDMDWGDRAPIGGLLTYSDGSVSDVELTWQSSDPSVASVTSTGLVFANAMGSAEITAEWDGWLRTSVEVEVSGDAGTGPLVADRFDVLDTQRWLPVGHPQPISVTRDGEPALLLRGDGLHDDGVISAEPLRLAQGGTIEFEFQISEFTDLVAQRLRVCLSDTDVPDQAHDGFELRDLAIKQQTCVQYPGGYPAFQTDRISVTVNPLFATLDFPTPEGIGPGAWIHLALQLRADGEMSVLLNRETVVRSPLRVDNRPESQWRVVLLGHSVGTEVLVREFRVWAGERY